MKAAETHEVQEVQTILGDTLELTEVNLRKCTKAGKKQRAVQHVGSVLWFKSVEQASRQPQKSVGTDVPSAAGVSVSDCAVGRNVVMQRFLGWGECRHCWSPVHTVGSGDMSYGRNLAFHDHLHHSIVIFEDK